MSRRRGPGLIRTMGRTAAITATATATNRAVNNAANQRAMQAQATQNAAMQTQLEMEQMKAQLAAMQSPPTEAVPPPVPVPNSAAPQQPDLLAQLQQLAQLKDAGMLTEEEFQIAKAKILG